MDHIVDREGLKNRELSTRVTTLELLVADLIHLVRQLDPGAVDVLTREALRDVDLQVNHSLPDGLEHPRFRLKQVLESRARNLGRKRFSARLATQKFSATD